MHTRSFIATTVLAGVLAMPVWAGDPDSASPPSAPYGPGMMGPGYGMGPGMMGPGYGYPYGMGPGMMGPGYGYPYGMGPGMMGQGYGYPNGMGPGHRCYQGAGSGGGTR